MQVTHRTPAQLSTPDPELKRAGTTNQSEELLLGANVTVGKA